MYSWEFQDPVPTQYNKVLYLVLCTIIILS